MREPAIVAPSPWYRSLDGTQWKALVASNLGWTFDGFEVFALILTVGVALHQLLDPSQHQFIPAYAGAIIAISVRLGIGRAARRRAGGLPRPQALDDPDHPRLFAAHRLERVRLGLAILRRAAFSRRARDRLGMGDGRLDHRRAVAGQGAREGRTGMSFSTCLT